MITNLSTISVKQLKRAVNLREKIESLQNELAAILGESTGAASGGRRIMSAAARARISAAQKARWAKQRNGGIAPGVQVRRKMSAAARAKIAAAARARWAKAKAENRNSLAAV